jgi:hypothetical protein
MKIDKVNKGDFVMVKSIYESNKMTSVMFIGEDPH